MSGISIGPGLYRLFVMKTGARCALDLSGFKTEVEAVEHLVRIAMVDEDTPARRKAFLDAVAVAVQHMEDEPLPPFCIGCGQEIDPDACHCGERSDHPDHSGSVEVRDHQFVPDNCNCLRHEQDWVAVAKGLRERLLAERAARGTP